MSAEPIEFFNRLTGKLETEQVYGGAWLNWTYCNPLGKLSLHGFVKRSIFSRWYGWRMDRPGSREKVVPFIKEFGLNADDFADAPESFKSFNEFFYRRLKPEARPICENENAAIFPADGRHLGYQDISKIDGVFVKGAMFSIDELLDDARLADEYRDGSMVISRLCPVDYHRYHFPVGGNAEKPRIINGPLYSVNPIALKQNIRIFSENKRALCRIESDRFGPVMMLEIGATCVGGMEYTFDSTKAVEKGDEKGFFKFGGSSTMLLFRKGAIKLADDLLSHSAERRELYALMGDRMGEA